MGLPKYVTNLEEILPIVEQAYNISEIDDRDYANIDEYYGKQFIFKQEPLLQFSYTNRLQDYKPRGIKINILMDPNRQYNYDGDYIFVKVRNSTVTESFYIKPMPEQYISFNQIPLLKAGDNIIVRYHNTNGKEKVVFIELHMERTRQVIIS